MEAFLKLAANQRAEIFERAADELGLTASAIEKDFWVCWVLRELFQSEVGSQLTFKGGTSLSKCWGLIDRFSEDIDLVVDRGALGFAGEASPEAASSRKEQERRSNAVMAACQQHVRGVLLPALSSAAESVLAETHARTISLDADDRDQQTILFEYASRFAGTGYLRPIVKVELGARSDTEPHQEPRIRPYVARVANAMTDDGSFRVRAVAPERTFWEKVSLLHEESYRAAVPRARLARHYYDLWSLDRHGIAESALQLPELFRRVVEHRRLYFRGIAEGQRTLAVGKLRLVPVVDRMPAWRSDFEAMRETMFFDEPPAFDEIMAAVRGLEDRINRMANHGG